MTLVNGISIGMIFAAITLIFKKIGSILNFVNTALLFELIFPIINLPNILKELVIIFIPFAGLIAFIQNSFSKVKIMKFHEIFFYSFLNTFIWLIICIFIYKRSIQKAKKDGILGLY